MREYFVLQYKMTNRKFKDAGIEPILGYGTIAVVFVGLSIVLFNKTEFAAYIYVLAALSIMGSLSDSQRTEFLKICFGNGATRKLRIIENVLCSIPFVAFLLYKQLFLFEILVLTLATLLALVDFRTTFNYTLWTPFSKKPFEFTMGFRNTFYLLLIAYVTSIIAVSVTNFNLGLFAILLVFITTMGYYPRAENKYYIWTYTVSPRKFLLDKIKTAIVFSTLLALPLAIGLALSFSENAYLLPLTFLVGWAYLITVIVCKYSVYPSEMNTMHSILLALSLWFPPVLIVLIPYLFKKSESRLSRLLK